MASSTIRKAIGVVKDQTSISIAKVSGNTSSDLEVLIVKATGHNNEPADEKYITEILHLTSHSKTHANACISAISKRLSKTHDWIVALKALMLIHRLLVDGDPLFIEEMIHMNRVLNMSDFHDEAHSNSWEHSGFVKSYAMCLDRKLELMAFEQKVNCGFKEMKTEKVLERLHSLIRVLDRVLSCRPTGDARYTRMVRIALNLVLEESFRVFDDACEMLKILLQRLSEMEYDVGVKAFDQSVYATEKRDELVGFYNWCMDIGVCKSLKFPNMNEIKALPPPPPPSATMSLVLTADLLDLKDDALLAHDGSGALQSQDPFAASLRALPPFNVQIADMDKKPKLVVKEHVLWQQYVRNGMQGAKIEVCCVDGDYRAMYYYAQF